MDAEKPFSGILNKVYHVANLCYLSTVNYIHLNIQVFYLFYMAESLWFSFFGVWRSLVSLICLEGKNLCVFLNTPSSVVKL